MVSSPEAIRALYSERGPQPAAGRTLSLRPIVGPRSVLLLEGAEHLSRRRLMLPPFHGDRMRAYEPTVREATAREIARWPADAVRGAPEHAGDHARGDPARRLRRRRRRAPRAAARAARAAPGSTASAGLQFSVLLARRLGDPDPLAQLQALMAEIDAMLARRDRRAPGRRRGDGGARRHLLAAGRGALRGRRRRWSDREIRDQLMTLLLAGHETTATGAGVDPRPAHPPPRRRSRGCAPSSTPATRPTCAR